MPASHDAGRKRRDWNVARAVHALEKEVCGIDSDIVNEAERAIAREAAVRRLEVKRAEIRSGARKEDGALRTYDLLAPIVALLRQLQGEQNAPSEHLLRMARLASKTRPRVAEILGQFSELMAPLAEMGELDVKLAKRVDPIMWQTPRRALAALKQLLAHLDALSTEALKGYTPVHDRLEDARAQLIGVLRDLDYSQGGIAQLIDPDGWEENSARATDRIRKELEKLRKTGPPAAAANTPRHPGTRARAGGATPSR